MNDVKQDGANAFEQGKSFILDNPYHPWFDERHYAWSEGYLQRQRMYEEKSRAIIQKEDEEYNLIVLKEKEKKDLLNADRKYKKTKKGKAEEAGQTTLF